MKSNSAIALEQLRALLDQGGFEADQRLPTERHLAEQLGVGRRAVRRALDVLEMESRIWRRQGAGTFVGAPPGRTSEPIGALTAETNMIEVMEVRLRLEPSIAQLAALRVSRADMGRLAHIVAKVDASRDPDGRELWDGAFHRAIAEIAGNRLLLALFDVVDRVRQDEAWRHIREAARTRANQALYSAQHADILKAIAERNPSGAEAAMRRHLLSLNDNLTMRAEGGLTLVS